MSKILKLCLVCGFIFILAAPAFSSDITENVNLNGFGGWAYGKTDENNYIIGDEEGDYSHVNLALNVRATPFEDVSMNGQACWHETHEGTEVEVVPAVRKVPLFPYCPPVKLKVLPVPSSALQLQSNVELPLQWADLPLGTIPLVKGEVALSFGRLYEPPDVLSEDI